MTIREQQALSALTTIIPVLEKYGFKWVITGGFACYVYGVPRELTDIDIDIDISGADPRFQEFVKELEPYITQPLEHFVDQNYDNYNFALTINEQLVDVCPMKEMKIINTATGKYEPFYDKGFPETETGTFFGMELPLLSRELIIKNKEMLVLKRESDISDIAGLHMLIEAE
jgi:hypothetical protein